MPDERPLLLLDNPAPILKQKLFHNRRLTVWEGRTEIAAIKGWADNPRIGLHKDLYQETNGPTELTQEQIFEIMKNNEEDYELKKLRDDIIENGLREPLVLTHSGKLLDGNRRFFAIKYALETIPDTDPNKQDLKRVDVFVLLESATVEDEDNVLVQENFNPSLKIEWPEYLKARQIMKELEEGLSIRDAAKKFGWKESKITQTKKIYDLIVDFILFATEPHNPEDENGGGLDISQRKAEHIASKNYQYFNEGIKSFSGPLSTDFGFKIQFFKWINEEKFHSFQEVRIAYEAWTNEEAKSALLADDPQAAKNAKAILDYNKRIVRGQAETLGRIENFTEFLKHMTAEQIRDIPDTSIDKLKDILDTLIGFRQ